MLLIVLAVLVSSNAEAAVQFSAVKVMGTVSSGALDESSGLAASRVHKGVVYAHNDHGDKPRIFAMDPLTGHKLATLTIDDAHNHDWEDICVGTCGQGDNSTCIYIGDIGDGNGHDPRKVYKVREPAQLHDATLNLVDTYTFTWDEDDAESLVIDPNGDLYIISKVHHGNGLFAKLPRSGWGSSHAVHIGQQDAVRLALNTGGVHVCGEERRRGCRLGCGCGWVLYVA